MTRDMLADPNWRPSRSHYEQMRNRATAAEAALARETEALNLTRTALTDSTALLAKLLPRTVEWHREQVNAQIVANQVALQLAVAEADKPHDGNER